MDNKDWADLFNQFNSKRLDFENNKQFFTKIAFDVYQPTSSGSDSLWILEDGEDGKQYLVATYGEDEITAGNDWSAVSNKSASMVVLCYKNFPIQKFASDEFNFTKEDVNTFEKALTRKAKDAKFIKSILALQPEEKKEALISQFPELKTIGGF